MTPSSLTGRRALALTALLPVLLLPACGEDDPAAAETSSSADAGAAATQEASASADEIDAALDSLDEMPDDSLLDTVGQSVVTVLDAATGYEVDGDVLYVDVEGDPAESLSRCQIVLGAAAAFVDDPQVVLRYPGDEVDCSQS